MTPAYFNRVVRRELAQFLRDDLLDTDTWETLAARYVVVRWDWRSLGRWFLIFGAISFAAGMLILLRDIIEFTYEKLAVVLFVLMLGCFAGGEWVKRRNLLWTRRTLELLGGFTLIGLTFTLGIIFSTGSGNWPALLLIDLVVLLVITYLLNNVLLLILSAVVFFTWFGGVTGYVSGWGAYWFGMNYPLRFLLASIGIIAVAVVHWHSEQGPLAKYRGFFKVWLASGLFFAEMALWLMSLFGNYGAIDDWSYAASAATLFLFNILWAGGNIALIYLGARYLLRMMRGFGVTFMIIQAYTLFFWHVCPYFGPWSILWCPVIAGGSALVLAAVLEKRLRGRESDSAKA